MKGSAYFSHDYASARERFCAAAKRLGLACETYVIAARGPQGESLSIDVAVTATGPCRRVIIVSSGLHGVEGFLGSAAQLAWLDRLADGKKPPADTKVVFVHALNPFGFAWLRRWNESNVDLNRNFLADRDFLAGDEYRQNLEAYERHFAFLNPAGPPSRGEIYLLKAVARIVGAGLAARRRLDAESRPSPLNLAAIARLGLEDLKRSLLGGQYHHPRGLFYGGEHAEESTRWLQARLPEWVAGAQSTLHLDLHSGLGERGNCMLIGADPASSAIGRTLAASACAAAVDEDDVYRASGAMLRYFRELDVGGDYRGLTVEFGTASGVNVMRALRGENQAHWHSTPDEAPYQAAKRHIVEAFAPASSEWRDTVVAKAIALIDQAVFAATASEADAAGTSRSDAAVKLPPGPFSRGQHAS